MTTLITIWLTTGAVSAALLVYTAHLHAQPVRVDRDEY